MTKRVLIEANVLIKAHTKDVQIPEEASSPPESSSNIKVYIFPVFIYGTFLASQDPNPDSLAQLNPVPKY
jgi:hypothetical protein